MHLSHHLRIFGGTLGVGVALWLTQKENVVYAAWTTNFEPSVKWDHNWDRRGVENFSSLSLTSDFVADLDTSGYRKPTATRHLLLIRHGQTTIEKDDTKRVLTKLGQTQAEFCGRRLKALNFPVTTLTSSTLTRAVRTADIIHRYLPGVPRQEDPLLCEGLPIPPEPAIGKWRPEKKFYDEGIRLEAAFRKYFYRADPTQMSDSYEILVCHANIIRYFVCRAVQLPPEAWLRLGLNHASITWVRIRPSGRVTLLQYGDSGFIPAEQVSYI
ncbi:serine/threonine-protein phosphatase PGAM5, mitochondrial-like [Saccostrea cucullata]|uniref:serine/threonine-protein phosphatase PGAM5, mitochondrial-like n=1 Tax=Saccostrea cuccullata TaxID=36930 RepID=UPI002ED0CCC6